MATPSAPHARAGVLRAKATDAERKLWYVLRNRHLGAKFVRQHPIGPFFADFACREADLVIELDGSQHIGSQTDVSRTRVIESHGYRVIRFLNIDILLNMDGVVEVILAELAASPRLRFDRDGSANTTSPPGGEVGAQRRVRGPSHGNGTAK